jgi:hypothetical protein
MSITCEEGYFIYETLGVSEIMVFLVDSCYWNCYHSTVHSSLDERRMGW